MTITLLSRGGFDSHDGVGGPGGQDQKPLLGRVGRVAPSVDILASTTMGTFLRLINVHLDSLPDFWRNRVRQMDVLTSCLHEPGCVHGIITGDFNAVGPEDEKLVDKRKGLLDAWDELGGTTGPNGHTWGVCERVYSRVGLARWLTPKDIEVLRPGSIWVSEPDREISIP